MALARYAKVLAMAVFFPSASRSFEPAPVAPVIACVDASRCSVDVARAAAEYARWGKRPLILLHAIGRSGEGPPDPLEWNIRRQVARRDLGRLRETLPDFPQDVSVEFNDGDWLTAMSDYESSSGAVLAIAAPRPLEGSDPACRLARLAAENHPGSVLLVPPGYLPRVEGKPRIAVPIDGSNYGAAALAEAIRLARHANAELLLVHVVPEGGLTDFGPPTASDIDLRMRLDRRNEDAAYSFLETTRRRLADQGLAVRSLCLKGDTRSSLLRALAEEAPDLVILSARGHGGKRCNDMAIGGTASYLIDHLTGPVMLLRSTAASADRHTPPNPHERLHNTASAA